MSLAIDNVETSSFFNFFNIFEVSKMLTKGVLSKDFIVKCLKKSLDPYSYTVKSNKTRINIQSVWLTSSHPKNRFHLPLIAC